MANTKSALKQWRASERRRQRNKPVRSALKTYIKKAETLIAAGNVEAAQQATIMAMSRLDKAAGKRVIHANTADRKKSRLQRRLNATAAA
ncbi:MAG: 30S ribosomal protein S20 [Chloroflexi bacterium]|nr:30S ribosomal protein S20 [Chloroflexota bacterium]